MLIKGKIMFLDFKGGYVMSIKRMFIIGFAAFLIFSAKTVNVKADTAADAAVAYANLAAAQCAWNEFINQEKAAQAALSSTYSDQLIASNQTALMNQAILVHSLGWYYPNPVSIQASANWIYLNMPR